MIDSLATHLDAFISIIVTLVSIGVCWGILDTKVRVGDRDIEQLKEDLRQYSENHVSFEHFEAVTRPFESQINEIRRDIKQILLILSNRETRRNSQDPI
jgi:hypothetical protein